MAIQLFNLEEVLAVKKRFLSLVVFFLVVTLFGIFFLLEKTSSSSLLSVQQHSGNIYGNSGLNSTNDDEADLDMEAGGLTIYPGKLVMSVNATFPPYAISNDDGCFTGLDIELAELISKGIGVELQIDDMSFEAALLAVQNRKSDIVMGGISVKEDRLRVMDFSEPYSYGKQVILVKNDSILSIDLLQSGKYDIGAQKGTTGYFYASLPVDSGGFGEENVVAFENVATAIIALKNRQVDCVVCDVNAAVLYIGNDSDLFVLDEPWVKEDYAIGLAKDNHALLFAINNQLQMLKEDGTLQQLLAKYGIQD